MFSNLHGLLWGENTFSDNLSVKCIWNLMFKLDMAQWDYERESLLYYINK